MSWTEVGLKGDAPQITTSQSRIGISGSLVEKIYVLSSYFNTSSNDYGGSFSSTTEMSQMLIEECVFDNCYT